MRERSAICSLSRSSPTVGGAKTKPASTHNAKAGKAQTSMRRISLVARQRFTLLSIWVGDSF